MIQNFIRRIAPRDRILLVLLLLAGVLLGMVSRNWLLEDAWMHIRYAVETVRSGNWSTWNPGEPPVSGDTSPLWLAMLVVFRWVGICPICVGKLAGILAWLALGWELYRWRRERLEGKSTQGVVGDVLFLLGYLFLAGPAMYAVSGMETVPALWITVHFLRSQRRWGQAIWAIPLVLVRPEGAMFVFVILVVTHWKDWRETGLRGLPALVVWALYLIWHKLYFGQFFPNTYYAKADLGLGEGMLYGARSLFFFGRDQVVLFGFAAVELVRRRRFDRQEKAVLAVSVFLILYLLRVGGDNAAAFPYHRHLLWISIFAWVYAYNWIERTVLAAGLRHSAVAVLVAALTFSHLIPEFGAEGSPLRSWRPAVKRLLHLPGVGAKAMGWSHEDVLRLLPRGSLVATAAAGRVPARFPDLRFLDMLGLHDTWIAHNGKRQYGQVDTRTDMEYSLAKKPDAVILPITSASVEKGLVRRGITHWRIMVDEAFADSSFQRDYALIPTNDNALFVNRRDLHFLDDDMAKRAIPVSEVFKGVDQD